MKNKKLQQILLVDDDEMANFINHRLIKLLDICADIKVVSTVSQALAYLKYQYESESFVGPEIIFLDYDMPLKNGMEFLEAFNRITLPHKQHTSCVWLSVFPEITFKHTNIQYTAKPLTAKFMWDAVDQYHNSNSTRGME